MEKMIRELQEANKELIFQCEEKEKCAAALIIANEELANQNEEKEKRAAELLIANKGLSEYISGLKEMMFVTSHKVRKPVANIIGICSQLEGAAISPAELAGWVKQMKQSAVMLDVFTKELTTLMTDLGHKADSA